MRTRAPMGAHAQLKGNHAMTTMQCLLMIVIPPLTALVAQAQSTPPPAQPEIRVLSLTHMDERAALTAIKDLGLPAQVAAAGEGRLALSGEPAMLDQIERMLSKLDAPQATADQAPATYMLPLNGVDPTHIRELLGTLLRSPRARFGIDPVNRVLALNGSDAEYAAVQTMIKNMARPTDPVTLQLFFLSDAPPGDAQTKTAPRDLEPVLAPLADSGFANLHPFASMVVVAAEGEEFELAADVSGNTEPAFRHNIQTSGRVVRVPDRDLIGLELQARMLGNPESGNKIHTWFQVHTAISTEPGKYVVLAAAPAHTGGARTIVLVVRALRTAPP